MGIWHFAEKFEEKQDIVANVETNKVAYNQKTF